MFYPDLHAIGFDYPEWEDLMDDVMAQDLMVSHELPDAAFVLAYQDESGAHITIVNHGEETGFSTQSGFECDTHVRAEVFRFSTELAHITFLDADDAPLGTTLATMRDPFRYPLVVNEEGASSVLVEHLGMSGLAVSCTFADSLAAAEISAGVKCPSLEALMAGESTIADSVPVAMVAMEIASVERRINSLTAQPFWVITGEAVGTWTVTLPGDIEHTPKVGEAVVAEVLVSVGVK